MAVITFVCQVCNTTVTKTVCNGGPRKYCSKACAKIANKGKLFPSRTNRRIPPMTLICIVCQNPFVTSRAKMRYCGKECADIGFVTVSRSGKLKRQYGLTAESWNALFESQGRVCANPACKATKSGNWEWNTDHDHETGQVRGILCNLCNMGLGSFRDNPSLLQGALEYLANPPARQFGLPSQTSE